MSRIDGIAGHLLDSNINVSIPTSGFSMFPVIRTGDSVTICPDKNISLGDIIVFKRNDLMVCHRVKKVFEKNNVKYYQTRGDSFFTLDEPVTLDRILGKIVKIERKNISPARRALLLINPFLRIGSLNAITVSLLVKIRKIFSFGK